MPTSHSLRRSMASSNSVVTKLRPFSTCFMPPSFLTPSRPELQTWGHRMCGRPSDRNICQTEQLRTIFVDSLVRAGKSHCHGRTRKLLGVSQRKSSALLQKPAREDDDVVKRTGRIGGKRRPFTKKDPESFLDYDDSWSGAQTSSEKPEEDEPLTWSERDTRRRIVDAEEGNPLDRKLDELDQLLMDDTSTPEAILSAYKKLPSPGISCLTRGQRIYLVRRLSNMDGKTTSRTISYLSLLDDYRTVGLPIPRHAWNSALSLGSTTLRKMTEDDVEFAITTWKEMETKAGVVANVATFNILFVIASKAGKFRLAELILEEMDKRGLKIERYTFLALIMYHGLRKDSQGVRKAYRDLTQAGEIVDTGVLNCVISALLSADEPDAAFGVLGHMKELTQDGQNTSASPKLPSNKRDLFRLLTSVGKYRRGEGGKPPIPDEWHEEPEALESMVSLAPDAVTFTTLLRYCCNTGEFTRAFAVLEDMHDSDIAHGEDSFTHMFRAFGKFGEARYTAWTPTRLETVWDACKDALITGDVILNDRSKLMGIWALIAMRRLRGSKAAARVYEVLGAAWQGKSRFDLEFIDPSDWRAASSSK